MVNMVLKIYMQVSQLLLVIKGVEKIVELPLDKNEKKNFDLSIKAVQKLFEAAIKIDKDLAN